MFPETNDATLGFPISFEKCCGKSNRFNDTHTAKLLYAMHTEISWNINLAVSEIFHMFTQSIKFYTSHCHILQSTDAWTKWFIKQAKNKRLLPSATFTTKFELFFVLTQASAFS